MADPSTHPSRPAVTPNVDVRVDDRDRPTEYVNAFVTTTTAEEILLDVGVNAASTVGGAHERAQLDLKLTSRLAMNYFTAKRLALTLARTVREYEATFGEIELDAARRARRPNAADPGAAAPPSAAGRPPAAERPSPGGGAAS